MKSDDVRRHAWREGRGRTGGLVAGLLLAVNLLLLAAPAASAETRTLKLYFLHTKERAEITYKRNGRYIKSGLDQVNNILRDWRRDEPTNMDPRLLDLLWEVYRASGSRDYIHVVSAYRSPATNAMLRKRSSGVAKKSQHMLGKAVDFFLPDVRLSKLRNLGLKYQVGGVGYYPKSGSPFVHLDVGGVRHWPRMSRKELVSVFPNGKTLHVPSDGKPLPGYEQALAAYKGRQSNGGAIQVADDTTGRDNSGRGLLAILFGGGADEAEDNAEAATAVAQRAAPARQQQQARQPQPPQAVPQPQEEADSPATIIAALPARSLPVPRQAPRPDLNVGTELPVRAEAEPLPAAEREEEPEAEESVLTALDLPRPTPRPDYEPAVQTAGLEDADAELPAPVAYATPTRRPDRPPPSDVIADLLATQPEKTLEPEPAIAAASAAPTLAALRERRPEDGGESATAGTAATAIAAASLPASAALDRAPGADGGAQPADSPRTALLASNGGIAPAALVSGDVRTAPKGGRPGPADTERTRASLVAPADRTPTKIVLSRQSVLNTHPQATASAPAFSPKLAEAPTAVYTDGFSRGTPAADARRFTGQAVTFLSLAKFDGR